MYLCFTSGKFDKRKETRFGGFQWRATVNIFRKCVNLKVEKITIDSAGRVAYGVAIIVFGILHFIGAESLLKLIPFYMPGGPWL
jgi:uncharacterized membrane protein